MTMMIIDSSSLSSWISSTIYIVTLYSVITLVHILCPARTVEGYVCNVLPQKTTQAPGGGGGSGGEQQQQQQKQQYYYKPLIYHLNGFRCLCIVLIGFVIICFFSSDNAQIQIMKNIELYYLCEHYLQCAIVSNFIGLLVSFYFVFIRFPSLSFLEKKANNLRRAPTSSSSSSSSSHQQQQHNPQDLDDRNGSTFYWGKEFNPRWNLNNKSGKNSFFIFDVKMYLYLIGAIVLGLNVLSSLYYFIENTPTTTSSSSASSNNNINNAILVYTVLMIWFLVDYMWYEEIHLYTYDIFAEKIGFKLVWGCLCFYPFFYPIGIVPFVIFLNNNSNTVTDLNLPTIIAIVALYGIGSILTRGANLQKFYFRRYPNQSTITLFGGLLKIHQRTVPSSNNRLLCSGFWGLSRHINYLGEIIQSIALALPSTLYYYDLYFWTTRSSYYYYDVMILLLPWLYPIYYVALFIPRQQDDEKIMRQKYGSKIMDQYIDLVPYKIIPGLY